MKLRTILIITGLLISKLSIGHGSIDIDTNIQTGVVGTEHVKITSSAFSLHHGAGGTPLIYGDFSTGNAGIGTTDPSDKLTVVGNLKLSNKSWFTEDDALIQRNGGSAFWIQTPSTDVRLYNASGTPIAILTAGNTGIGLTNTSQNLSVNGNASKSTEDSWVANSDARVKKEIIQFNAEQTLQKLLQLKGVIYEWDDDKTGIDRPEGIQYGFTAQNIQEVFPSMTAEDKMGYLQSTCGNYDAMFIEAIRALNNKIIKENEELRALNIIRREIETKVGHLQTQTDRIINQKEKRHSSEVGNLTGSKQ